MKRKTIGLLCGASAFTVAISIAASMAFARNSVLFSKISETRGQVNTFVIDEETDFVEDSGLIVATAISGSENTLQTLFYGFELDGDDLVLRANTPAFFENIDPMNRGFNAIHAEFVSDASFDYSVMCLFSYHQMDPEEVMAGKYADMSRIGSLHAHSDANFTLDETFTSTTCPGMENARYALGLFSATRDIRLSELTLGTSCLVEPPVISEEGEFSDYSSSEKALMTSKLGEVLPFVGTGVYYFDDEDRLCGIFFDDQLGEQFVEALQTDMGFETTSEYMPQDESDTGRFSLQKETIVDGNPVIETVIIEFRMVGVITYKVTMSTEMDWIGRYDEWPTEFIEESLSDEFADVINDDPLNEPNMVYQMMTYQEKGETALIMQILDDVDSELSILQTLKAYVAQVLADNPTYQFRSETPGPLPAVEPLTYNEYEYVISDGVHTICVEYEQGEGLGIIFYEVLLVDTFPTDEINTYLGLTGGDSIIPYTGEGKFRVSNSHNVYVYFADVSELEAYRQTLELNGFVNRDNSASTSCTYVQNAFGTYYIYMSWGDMDRDGYFGIYFYEESKDYFKGTFKDAKEAMYSDQLILDHDFPEISGNHTYRIQKNSTNYIKEGIYISDLGQAYLDLLFDGATYNNYFGCYVFTDEDDGSNYFGLEAELVSGGIRLHARLVSMSDANLLLDSVDANAKLAANYSNLFEYLMYSDPDVYASYMAALPQLPNSNGEKVYYVEDYSPTVYFYGNNKESLVTSFDSALITNGFVYSRLQSMYHFGTTNLKVDQRSDKNSYGSSCVRFSFTERTSYPRVDFVSHSAADLSALETQFAALPYTGDEEMFYHPAGVNKVIADNNFDLAQFKSNLIAADFKLTRDYGTEFYFEKEVGVALYKVEIRNYDYDSAYEFYSETGFWRIEFFYDSTFFDTFTNEIAAIDPSNMPNSTTLAHLPDLSSHGATFHVNSSSSTYLEVCYKSSLTGNDIIAALVAAGYQYDSSKNTYVYYTNGGNFAISCYIDSSSRRFQFSYIDLTYTTWPDYRENLTSLYYRLHDYIVGPDETGNIYKEPDYYYQSSFYFRLSKDVDIQAYLSKLQNLGYELTYSSGNRWDLTYEHKGQNPFEITCQISEYVESYYVQFWCNNNLPAATVSTADIAYSLAGSNYSDAVLFENSFTFKMRECNQHIGSESTYGWMNFYYDNEVDDKASVLAALRADGGYTEVETDYYFRKETAKYTYRIYVNDNYWEIYIDVNPQP